MFWTGLAAGACLLVAASGVVALTTGWLIPTLRCSVARAELWGIGALTMALGMATGMSLRWLPGSTTVLDAGGVLTLALIVFGGVLQVRAKRPLSL
jgi:hypothetical protein